MKQHVEKKLVSLLVVFFRKALNGTFSPLCGTQVMQPSNLSIMVGSLTKDMQTEHEFTSMNE